MSDTTSTPLPLVIPVQVATPVFQERPVFMKRLVFDVGDTVTASEVLVVLAPRIGDTEEGDWDTAVPPTPVTIKDKLLGAKKHRKASAIIKMVTEESSLDGPISSGNAVTGFNIRDAARKIIPDVLQGQSNNTPAPEAADN